MRKPIIQGDGWEMRWLIPLFYPVVCLITGSTPRGGGVWKDILHGHPRGLLRRDPPLPLMTSAPHETGRTRHDLVGKPGREVQTGMCQLARQKYGRSQ